VGGVGLRAAGVGVFVGEHECPTVLGGSGGEGVDLGLIAGVEG